MKKILFLLFAASTLMAAAQNKSTVETRALVHNLNQAKSVDNMSKNLLQRYPVININNKSYIGVIAKVDGDFDAAGMKAQGIRITSQVENIIVLRVPVEQLAALEGVRGIETYTVAHRVSPEMNKTRVDTRTDSIQEGLGVPQPFNGEGVLIGITDWGFDYTHPNINKNNNKRIIRAWDHFKLSGPAPEGFDYGTEYRTPEEVRAAKCDTAGLYGYGTHGTHVAGICGGNGTNAGEAIGQAPGAQFIVGSFLLDEASWLDQVAWMKQVADGEGKRLVINSSWGMYTFSTLDGTSLLSQAIDSYSNQGVVFVTSGGNNGDEKFHLKHTFTSESDTLKSVAAYYSSGIGQGLIYWGEAENGERRTENGERRTENGERRTESGERRTENGERRTWNGERRTENGERGTENGERGAENGERGAENGERRTENGERKAGGGGFKAGFALVKKVAPYTTYYSPLYSTQDDIDYLESYVVADGDTIHYDIMVESSNPLDNRPHVLLNVAKNNGYKLMMLCMAEEGTTVHVWNMANLANNAGNMGCEFMNDGIFGCQNGDTEYGIGEPACAEKTISVAAHVADYYNNSGNYLTGDLATFSSCGPTIDGRNKPEISAPGVNVASSLSSYSDLSGYSATYEAISGGRRYIWGRMSGTSMSSPAVTGIVALMLQANPNLSVDQIREILFTTARNDDKTGPLRANDSVSVRWGYGKADALKAVNAAYDKLDIDQAATIRPQLVVYPNPATERVAIQTGSNVPLPVRLFSADGRCVMQTTIAATGELDISSLSAGIYFVSVRDRAGVRTQKLVKAGSGERRTENGERRTEN